MKTPNNNIPKLRFPEFNDEWKLFKFDAFFVERKEPVKAI